MQELEKDRLKAEGAEPDSDDKPGIKFMIAGEAPVVVSRACELLIRELTCRAWQHTERNRRRTLQRQDIHAAVGESDVYDFLIDIVPRVAPSVSRSAPPPGGPEMGMHQHQAAAAASAAHGVPQQMDPGAQMMGPALGGSNDFFDQQQQFNNYILQMQQQQQAAAVNVGEQQMQQQQPPNRTWNE